MTPLKKKCSYTFDDSQLGVLIKYADGGPQYDGCGFAHVNFTAGDDTSGTYLGEDLGGITCPYLTQDSFPTTEPTLPPSSVSQYFVFICCYKLL